MFKPSAAPRRKMTTSNFFLSASDPVLKADRVRNPGIAVVPAIAIAPLRRKTRRVMDINSPVHYMNLRERKVAESVVLDGAHLRPEHAQLLRQVQSSVSDLVLQGSGEMVDIYGRDIGCHAIFEEWCAVTAHGVATHLY